MKPMFQAAILWLIPLVFMMHNIEEGLMIANFLPRLEAGIPAVFLSISGPLSLASYEVALTIVTVLVFAITAALNLRRPRGVGVHVMTGIVIAMTFNAIVHVAGALNFDGYVPGLATAVVIVLPFGAWIIYKAIVHRWIRGWIWPLMIVSGVLIHFPVLLWVLRISTVLAGSFDNPTFVPGRSFY